MNYSFIEAISLSKVLSVVMGLDGKHILTKIDLEIADKLLEKMIDEAPYWNQTQKDLFKLASDFVKNEIGEYRQ